MKFIIPVESIIQNLGGVILYDPIKNIIIKQYVHNKKWTRVGWRGGKVFEDNLITTDWNSIHYFDIKKWKYIKSFQKSSFNDLHYIELKKNKLFIVNTGLDAIEIFKNPMEPELIKQIFLFQKNSKLFAHREIDKQKKYNKMMKQKPHSAHPNCISFNNKQILVTCFGKNQKINSGEVINLLTGKRMLKKCFDCHDGIFYKNDFYLTWTRHSTILKFNNLLINKTKSNPEKIQIGPRGWWRGMIIKDDIIYVFASDGYKNKKTTTRMATINLQTKKKTINKLPVIDGIYWDTIYQPNLYKD